MNPFKYSFIFLLVASCADAQVIVDQEFVAPTNVGYFLDYPGDYMAQTFTVRNSGRLVQLAVQVVNRGGPVQVIDDLYMKLVRTDSAGSPVISDVLSSRTISRFAVPTSDSPVSMIPIDLTSDNLQMHVGDVLAITLSSNNTDANAGDGQYVWKEDFFDRISGGNSSFIHLASSVQRPFINGIRQTQPSPTMPVIVFLSNPCPNPPLST
jgi:hypothetical protein